MLYICIKSVTRNWTVEEEVTPFTSVKELKPQCRNTLTDKTTLPLLFFPSLYYKLHKAIEIIIISIYNNIVYFYWYWIRNTSADKVQEQESGSGWKKY